MGEDLPDEIRNGAMVTFELILTRTIQPDGQQGFIMSTPQEFSFVEALGLLEAGRWQLFKQMNDQYGRE